MFDDLSPEILAKRRSVKWTMHDNDVIEAWVADMDFDLAPPIRQAMQDLLDTNDIGYPGYDLRDEVRQAFADRMRTHFGWDIEPDDSWLLTTVVQAIHVALTLASEPGDGVVLLTPAYPPFLAAISQLNRRMVDAPLAWNGTRFELDEEVLDAAIDEGTRILLLCNPHNPTGRVFSVEELEAIGRVARRHDLVVVADEIHQDLRYAGHDHHVFAVVNPDLAERTLTLASASKTFNLAGNRCAVMHFGSSDLRARFDAYTHRFFGEVSLMGHVATLAAWTDPGSTGWLDALIEYLDGNRRFLSEALTERLPLAVHSPPEGTYLYWVDLNAYDVGENPAELLLEQGRVALGIGPDFGVHGHGFVRINMATSRAILAEIVDRMVAVLA
ncbi:MAG: MalY/PatB family protein [Acidimicrobiales bacterium]